MDKQTEKYVQTTDSWIIIPMERHTDQQNDGNIYRDTEKQIFTSRERINIYKQTDGNKCLQTDRNKHLQRDRRK